MLRQNYTEPKSILVLKWCHLCCLSILTTATIGYAQPPDASQPTGIVKDPSGAPVAQVTVNLLSARQLVVATTKTDAKGRFTFRGVAPGTYEVFTSHPGLAPRRLQLRVQASEARDLEITLGLPTLTTELTVTAEVGVIQPIDETPQQVNIVDEELMEERAKAVLAQAVQEEVGVQLQRTSPTIGGVFIRGLTGNKVLVFIDGIRYSTSAMRGGINTFLNLTDPTNLRVVEILRGPNSAQFGSDSIGGSLQLISRVPTYSPDRFEVRGRVSTGFHSADLGFSNSMLLTFGNKDLAVLANLSSHRSNTLRTGSGLDSHAAVTRFLGLPSNIFGERLTDTAFTQYGGLLRLNFRPAPGHQFALYYQRGQQDGGKRYDQMLGGDGNSIADLRNLMQDFFYLRYEKLPAGPFDDFSVSYSFNTQREERVNQGGNGNPAGAITHQYERTSVHGVQAQAIRQWGTRHSLAVGGEVYVDRVQAPSFSVDPVTNVTTLARPRVPDKASYRSRGGYIQDIWTLKPKRLRLIAALRYSGASYTSRAANSPIVDGRPLWPDDSLSASSLTPRVGAALTLLPGLSLSAQVSRGFRAPHITDLGTLGLTGNGFEVAVADLAGLGATVGTTADRNAVSTGIAVRQLVPETSWSYEAGVHLHRKRVSVDFNSFVNNVYDNIAVQSLILPAGAVGLSLGDQKVIGHGPNGVVFVAASSNPVLIRANFGDARIQGIEQKFDLRLSSSWTVGNVFTYLRAEDRRTGLPPNIEGGTPAPQGWLHLRYAPAGRRFWVEPYLHAAGRQPRLSSLDLEDRRTGATRSRASIASFFTRGATVRGVVAEGLDGRFGTADDILKATGETLVAVQNRVLGNASSAPLFTHIPGFFVFSVRGGFRIGEAHNVLVDLENLNDKNYRGISWGLDGPGRSFGVRYSFRF